ncbi:hypothetical protein B566_EDAN006139 [Ephemera danica]|nr:hypothetical protein B566_EDAN006139 [Ephemera danica]
MRITFLITELPAELRASNPPIELLEYASINSSAVRFLVRLPQYSEWRDNMPPVKVTSSRSATGPWVPVPGAENAQKTRELELVASGLEGSIHLLRIEHGELRSRAVRIHLPAPEATTTGHPVPAGTETCEHFGRQFMVGEGYLSTDCMQRCECVSAGNFTCAPTSSEAAAACRAAARKRGISGAETLEVLDSGEETVSLRWRGPAGMVLQARALGASGPWQRSERLTPDGTKDPVEVSFAALQPFTTYEIRAVLPGAEDGRSARLEDTPPAAVATTRPHPGQDAGFCVVLGRKIASGEEIPSPNGGCTENKCLCQPEEHGMNDPCEQCADNAECHKSMIASMADEALCMCKEGYEGDPYNKKVGCKPTGTSTGVKIADRMDRCVFKNTTYMPGENFTEGCEHRCTCSPEAEIVCKPRCPSLPENPGANCKLVTDSKDECCRMYKCDGAMADAKSETSTKAGESEMCHYKNATYQRGIKFDDGCEKQCTCTEGGDVFCQPRCPPPPSNNARDDKCVTVRDPKDHCCTVVLCDVTLADQDVSKASMANLESSTDNENITNRNDEVTMVPPTKRIALQLVETVNATAARLEARLPGGAKWPTGTPSVATFVRSSSGQWVKVPNMMVAPGSDGKLKITVGGLEPGRVVHLRVEHDDMRSEELEVELPAAAAGTTCEYKGQTYKRDDEFHDGCDMYCACTKTGVQCATIECPTDFGLDVLDPHCLDWEAEPGFVATPPRCCPDMHCRDNGSCHYMNQRFDNFAEIPTKLSGCEQRCYCEFGNVSCSPACPPVPAIPPSTLQCPSHEARLAHLPGEDCCKYWLCPQPSSGPPGNASSDSLNVTTPAKSDAAVVTSSPSNVTLDITSHMTTSSPDLTSHMTTSSIDMTSSQMTSDLTTTPHDVMSETSTDHTMTIPVTETTMVQDTNITEPLIIHTRLDSKKSDDKNQTEEFHGPFVINPNMEHKNESHEFSWPFHVRHEKENTSGFLGPFAPHPDEKPPSHHGELNETKHEEFFPEKHDSRTPTSFLGPFAPHPDEKPAEIPPHFVSHHGELNESRHVEQFPDKQDSRVPSGFLGPFPLHPHERPNELPNRQHPEEVNDTRDVQPAFIPTPVPPTRKFPGPFPIDRPKHHERPPFPFPGRPQQQTPPGPFLFRGEPVPGPIDGDDGPQIIGRTPDGHIIIAAQDPRNPVRVPPQRGHPQEFPYHEGQPPPFIPQRPTPGRRPGLSPIAAQIEEHLQRQQQQQQQPNQFHHPDEEIYHVRPHQGRPPPGAEVYQLPPDGEHFVLQDGSIIRIAPPSPQDSRQRTRPHEQTRPPGFPAQTRPHLPPHLADHTPDQVLTYVRAPPHVNASSSTIPHDADAVSSHSLEHTASRPAPGGPGFPTRPLATPFPPPSSGNEIQLQPPQPVGPRSVRLMFSVPPIFVGLHGRVEVQYTDDIRNEDISTWKRASSATDDIIESPQLVHEVTGLQPATSYRVQVAIRLRDLHNVVVSQIAQFTTPPELPGVQSTTLPPIIPIDAGLSIAAANSTWIRVTWRKFSEYELQFIDGIQIRYKEKEGKVYAATPLLHRLVDTYTLEDLRPGTEYEVAIFFIPFHGQNTELQAEKSVQATTGPLQADPYGFNLALTVGQVKANSVELTWDGVPYPEDKYVNIYRAIYQSDLEVGKQELSSTFKLAKRDAPHRTNVMELKPSTRYRIWLEAYLTNGKIKKSDVRTFTTKPGSLLSAGASEQLSGKEERSDYYGALVAVAIVAALAVVGLMILLMILVRRQSAASAAITPRPAKAESAAYDNPTYKTCDDPTPVATNGASKHHNNSSAPEEP